MAKEKDDELSARVAREVGPLKLKISQITRTDSIFNSNQIQKIFNTTNARYKYQRKGKGGGNWTYVRSSYIRRTLDSIFGFNWDFEIITPEADAFAMAERTGVCVVRGRLTGRVKHNGEWITLSKEQYGRNEVQFNTKPNAQGIYLPLDWGNNMKAAASDAFKKCASSGFGIAADVYDPDEFMALEIEGSDEADERAKNAKKMIEKNKEKLLAADAEEAE